MSSRRSLFAAAVVMAAACMPMAPPSSSPPPPPTRVSFDYTPAASCATPGSVRLTLGVVSPQWKDATSPGGMNGAYVSNPYATGAADGSSLREEFISALRADFFELLTCRGLLTKGPFDSFEQMVYPDREGSNLLLEPEMEMRLIVNRIQAVAAQSWLGGAIKNSAAGYKLTGSATLSGRVTLVLTEPLSNTRMWTRSIELPAVSADFVTDRAFYVTAASTEAEFRIVAMQDAGVMRALAPTLTASYSDILGTADKYLNTQELAVVAKQAAEVRKKAVIAVPR